MTQYTAKIAIPLFNRPYLTNLERISLEQALNVFKGYPKVLIKPASLDISFLKEEYGDQLEAEDFDDSFFGTQQAHNRLLLSEDFYRRFEDAEYVLIYHLDAFVFAEGLEQWCGMGYDYIGAPWICKPKYNRWYMKTFLGIRGLYFNLIGRRHRQQSYFKVGNGGLSLRRVDKCLIVCREMKEKIDYFNRQKHSQYNEDVFWSRDVDSRYGFRIPDWKLALQFAFDVLPEVAYEYNNKSLPWGCHAWPKKMGFWKDVIAGCLEKQGKTINFEDEE